MGHPSIFVSEIFRIKRNPDDCLERFLDDVRLVMANRLKPFNSFRTVSRQVRTINHITHEVIGQLVVRV